MDLPRGRTSLQGCDSSFLVGGKARKCSEKLDMMEDDELMSRVLVRPHTSM